MLVSESSIDLKQGVVRLISHLFQKGGAARVSTRWETFRVTCGGLRKGTLLASTACTLLSATCKLPFRSIALQLQGT